MNITVTHTLAPEIIALLKNLVKSQAIAEQLPGPDFKPAEPVKPVRKAGDIKTDTSAPAATSVPAAVGEPLTIEQVRAKAQEVSKSGKRDQVLELVQSYGVDSLPKLDPSHFADFLTKLKAL